MFNDLRAELNKIALMESDETTELDMMDTGIVGGDDGAADDELVDDENFLMEEDEDNDDDVDIDELLESFDDEELDSLIESILVNESEDCDDCDDDDYEDDDEDSVDYQDGVVGDGDTIEGEPDDDDYDEVDIDGITNSIHNEELTLEEDIEEDFEEDLDDILEACGDCVDEGRFVHADDHEIYGDSADMPDDDVPPSPQYERLNARDKAGADFVDYGNANYKKFGKVFLDKSLTASMTVDDDAYDEEGDDYDLYASAGNIYDDDENEEFYGKRDEVRTSTLYGRHSINNINAAELGDRFDGSNDSLNEEFDEDAYYASEDNYEVYSEDYEDDDYEDYDDDEYLDEDYNDDDEVASFLESYLD